jgi:hypothetical protein
VTDEQAMTEVMKNLVGSLDLETRQKKVDQSARQIRLATQVFMAVELSTFPLIPAMTKDRARHYFVGLHPSE